jgi:curli biogenesis system outer membrane secretion channel CsgG
MKNKIIIILFGLLIAGCATVSEKKEAVEAPVSEAKQVEAQEQISVPETKAYKMKIAIGRFTNETNYGRSLVIDQDFNRIGKQASDMLSSRLTNSGNFLVFERSDLEKIKKEHVFTPDSKMIGVDALIMGSVTEFGRSVNGKTAFLSSTKVQVARAKVDIRLIDVKTGLSFFSAIGAGEASTESGEIAGFGSRSEYDATLNDRAIAAAISDVIDKLVSKLQERPWKTDILEIQDGQIYISGGKKQGLKSGDVLRVMEYGNTVSSKQSGFNITLPPKHVATIKVVDFFGEDETSEGSVCLLVDGKIEKMNTSKLFVTEGVQ